MVVTAHKPANPLKQRVRTPSLVILELVLASLPNVGTAGEILHLSLMQNYTSAPSRLHHERIIFDFQVKKLVPHGLRMANIVSKLEKRCVGSIQLFFPLD